MAAAKISSCGKTGRRCSERAPVGAEIAHRGVAAERDPQHREDGGDRVRAARGLLLQAPAGRRRPIGDRHWRRRGRGAGSGARTCVGGRFGAGMRRGPAALGVAERPPVVPLPRRHARLSASWIADIAASVGSFNFVGLFAICPLPHADTFGHRMAGAVARRASACRDSPPVTRRTPPATSGWTERYPHHPAVRKHPNRVRARKKRVRLTALKTSLTLSVPGNCR